MRTRADAERPRPTTEAIDRLFLELAQFTSARTREELRLHEELGSKELVLRGLIDVILGDHTGEARRQLDRRVEAGEVSLIPELHRRVRELHEKAKQAEDA